MAYSDDIANLSASHYWSFDSNLVDSIGSVAGTSNAVAFSSPAIARDTSNALRSTATGSNVIFPSTSSIDGTSGRKSVSLFFSVDSIQPYGCSIYSETNTANTQGFQIIMAFGNTLMFEVIRNSSAFQIVSTEPIVPNRVYHIFATFEGDTFSANARLYIDGVRQLIENPSPISIDFATLGQRPVAELMKRTVGNSEVGLRSVLLNSAVTCTYQHLALFTGSAAVVSDQDIREILFEKGCISEFTVSTDTQANMQTALNSIVDNQGNAACCIEIEPVSGGGDFTLTSDKTFDSLASIHFRYNGSSDTLNIVNIDGNQLGNASIGSAPFGGNIIISDRQTLKINVRDINTGLPVSGARVYIKADAGGTLPAGTEIVNETTDALGDVTAVFDYISDQPIVGYVRKGSSPQYKQASIGGPLTSIPLDITVLMIGDD